MSMRLRHLVNDEIEASDASTFSTLLPETGYLHALFVTVKATNGATGGRAACPLDIADIVRVIANGEERIFELTPRELEKWTETCLGIPLEMIQDERAATVQSVVFPILFGRWFDDTDYFLPLSKVKSPKLEITYSPTIAADGGFATGTTTFNVTALWSPETDKLAYKGTLTTRTIKAFTSLASGDDPTDINVTDPIRAISVYAYEPATEDGTDITRVRLAANTGEYDLFACDWQDFLDINRYKHYADIQHSFMAFWQDNDVLLTRIGRIRHISSTVFADDDQAGDIFPIRQYDNITGDQIRLVASVGDITAGSETYVTDNADKPTLVKVTGNAPSYFGLIDYLAPDYGAGYLDPTEYSKLQLILTQGGAGADVRVGLQCLHQYN